jgi:GAF domain-containing protein/HAMP domain-containing protein
MKTKSNNPRQARSLTTTLAVAFFGLSALALLISGSLQIVFNIQSQQAALSSRQQLIAQGASKTVSSFILEKFSGLETAVEFSDPVSATLVTQKNIMESLLGLDPAFRQFALFNSRGLQMAQVSRISATLSPQFITLWGSYISDQTVKGEQFISPVYFDEATSEPLMAIAIPVKDDLGDFQGTLMAEVDLKFMWDLVDQLKIGETGYAYVVDNKGTLIAFRDTSRVLQGENLQKMGEVNEFVNNPGQSADKTPGIASYTGLLGTRVVGTYVPVGTPQWAVVTELPWFEAYQSVIQNIEITFTILIVLGILAGLVGVVVARRLAVPLVDLTKTATRIAAGEMELQAIPGGVQEVATLATAFNSMTAQLRDLIGTLEQHVADRTKALSTSADVSRRLSTIMDQQQLVVEVVEQVKSAFNYYHVHIYLLNEASGDLIMAGGTGEAGRLMMASGHKIPKSRGLVGRAASTNTAVLVPDTSVEPQWLPNPLLSETKSEAAIPITLGDQVLGVLDVQHNVKDGLKQEDVDLLQSIANQVAVAVQNARSYAEAQQRGEREALKTSINQKIQSATTVEGALQITARELGRTLGAKDIRVILHAPGWVSSQEKQGKQTEESAESAQNNYKESERLNSANHQFAAAHTKNEALQTAAHILESSVYPALVLSVDDNHLEVAGLTDATAQEILQIHRAVNDLETGWDEVKNLLTGDLVVVEPSTTTDVGQRSTFILPSPLSDFARQMGYQSAAFLPITSGNKLVGIIAIGSIKQILTGEMLQPFTHIVDLLGTTLDKILKVEEKETLPSEQEALTFINPNENDPSKRDNHKDMLS